MGPTSLPQRAEASLLISNYRREVLPANELVRARSHAMNRLSALLIVAVVVALIASAVPEPVQAQQSSTGTSQPAENVNDLNYHLTVRSEERRVGKECR